MSIRHGSVLQQHVRRFPGCSLCRDRTFRCRYCDVAVDHRYRDANVGKTALTARVEAAAVTVVLHSRRNDNLRGIDLHGSRSHSCVSTAPAATSPILESAEVRQVRDVVAPRLERETSFRWLSAETSRNSSTPKSHLPTSRASATRLMASAFIVPLIEDSGNTFGENTLQVFRQRL